MSAANLARQSRWVETGCSSMSSCGSATVSANETGGREAAAATESWAAPEERPEPAAVCVWAAAGCAYRTEPRAPRSGAAAADD